MGRLNLKKNLFLFLKICLASLAIWYLFSSKRISIENMTILFTWKNLPLIVLAAILLFCNQLMSTARLNRLLRTADIRLPFFQTFQLTMIGNFFNVMTPGMTGGDLVKGYYLYKSEKNNKGRSAGTLVLDRFMG